MITTQTEAKRFLARKVTSQAKADRVELSEAEREMLMWSESDPDITIDPTLPARLEAEISDADYEQKITALFRRSFQADVLNDPANEEEWRRAASLLDQGDHYISMMLDAAVGARWKRRWQKLLG